ncbi:MAG: hypothetical protein Q4E65_01995 [Clostridia bacterium]|nr:hypothetical protein [Clostridia bacterium]
MYASPVPLMILRADTDALIEVNGHLLGECGAQGYAAMPVSDTGDYYVRAIPLTAGHQPITRKISFEGGKLRTAAIADADVCLWPGGVVECSLQTRTAPVWQEKPIVLAQTTFNAYTLTLYRENEVRLSVEQQGKPLYAYALGQGEDGVFLPYGEYLGVLVRGERERLVLLNGSMQDVLDIHGDAVFLEEEPAAIERIGTRLGHERRVRYRLTASGFLPQRPETGFFTRSYAPPQDEMGVSVAFFEAVREGWEEEAMGYLTQSLRQSFSFADICAFLGEFGEVRPPVSCRNGSVMGLVHKQEGVMRARLYRLAFEQGKIDNLEEI